MDDGQKIDDGQKVDDKQKEDSDESILFPEIIVGDITIKPWSFGVLFEISPFLEVVIDKLEKKNLLDEFENKDRLFLPYTLITKLFTIASNEVLEVMAVAVGRPKGDIKGLSMEDGMKLAMVMYRQNKSTISNAIKNALSPLKK